MKSVELVPGISSSVLGFGCAPIMGSVDAAKARHALELALECGITHFDLARSYGYGDAERFVGRTLKSRRHDIVIASKFGIIANWKSTLLKPIKPLARIVRGGKKRQPSHVSIPGPTLVRADRFHDRIPMRGADMRGSLERSLRALDTDYLDYFFIHEPLQSIEHIDEISETAEALKTEGKIRAWGLAHMRFQEHLHHAYLSRFDVLQFDNSPGAPGYDAVVASRGSMPNVIFSPLNGGSAELKPADKLCQLYRDFPRSVVLCSMFTEQHIRENARLAA